MLGDIFQLELTVQVIHQWLNLYRYKKLDREQNYLNYKYYLFERIRWLRIIQECMGHKHDKKKNI